MQTGVLEGFILCFSFLESFDFFPDPDLCFGGSLCPWAAGPDFEGVLRCTGGRGLWGGSPWVFLPEPLLLFFFATLLAEEKAQVMPLSFRSLAPAKEVQVSFTNGPLFLTID